ncbi:hypothetical protein KFK09_026234 [Dendrobium nobile]|uniref:Uncharacterized protein n=1 Tax=Dendrobium nobile TaxID=94219 RepID=A0A8T3A7R1_DENNO|nr:hypothetical protein KFK09_026234 [Dendrobium nobile]
MSSLGAPPPSKRRKISKAENSVCNKKELKRPFWKIDDGKVLEAARGGSHDVNVPFYRANEVTLPDKKVRKIEKVWSDPKQGATGMLQTCQSYIKKDKEDMAKAGCSSHHDYSKHRTKHSSNHCSSLKTINLKDLLPKSKFHSVRKRTPFSYKVEHRRTGASLYSSDGLVSESKWGAAANRRKILAVPISVGAAQNGTSPLVSQNLGRAATESELIPVCGVKRKGSTLDGGGLDIKRKITKAYVRNKNREPFFKDDMPDLYALHLLADTALNLGPEPIFDDNVEKQEGESRQSHNEHEPLSTNSKSHSSQVNAERNVGEGSTSEAASVIPKDLQSDKVPLNANVLPEANQLICTSIDEKQNFNEELMKKDEELISNNNVTTNSLMTGFQVAKESHEVATNADQKADGVENECIDCQSSMRTQPSTLEGFQTGRSNLEDVTKLSCAPSKKDAFTPEHGERIVETIVEKDDIDLKRDSECFKEPHPVFVSVESGFHDKASSACCELEPCSTSHENSQPRPLACMETPQKSDGYPSSSNTKSLFDRSVEESLNYKGCSSSFNTGTSRDQSPGYRVREIVQSSKLEATRMVDAAIKVLSSTKVGDDAYAMIGKALNPAGIQQVGAHTRISRLQSCSYLQNGGPGNYHQDLSCNPAVVASIAHSINSTVPAFTLNDSQSSPKMISACVAALLMIQACSDTGLPPAEAMEILEQAAKDLQPQFPQNLHIYRDIEELMGIIKTQILSLVRTPGLNLHL